MPARVAVTRLFAYISDRIFASEKDLKQPLPPASHFVIVHNYSRFCLLSSVQKLLCPLWQIVPGATLIVPPVNLIAAPRQFL
jgi:hypothetical protein